MNFETITLHLEGEIATVLLNRPDKLNALNAQLLNELDQAFQWLSEQSNLRCVILSGTGPKAFAAGADIAELHECNAESGASFAERGQAIFTRIENFPVPVIAAVNGFALGGGCELAMACHFRYASANAKFGQPEVKLGIIPGYGGTQRLARLCGSAVAIELICSADIISAERALSIGLVNKVVPADELMTAALSTAQQIASMAPLAVQSSLRCIASQGTDPALGMQTEAREFGALCGSEDFREGTRAFLDKAVATFRGR